jgi:RNA polymerase-binding transcription factor DksA
MMAKTFHFAYIARATPVKELPMLGQKAIAKRKLLQARKQVLEQLSFLHELMQVELDLEPDEGDEEIVELEKNAVVTAMLKRKLLAINIALDLMEQGHYGKCARCGQPIRLERLEAKPDAINCVQCQREVERLNYSRQPVHQVS